MLLEGKVVVITGAGRGIGRGIARAAAAEGARVVATDLDPESAAETASALGEEAGALALELDVTRSASVESVIERTVAACGRIDGWVNNAGVLRMSAALEITPADWELQFAVNVQGLFFCSQRAARRMVAQGGGGAIVNVASNAGKAGYPDMAAYNATKAAVIGLTRSLAGEWAAHRINVNAICPGGVTTPMLESCAEWIGARSGEQPGDVLERMVPRQLGRHIDSLEVGRLAAFLLSERAELIRGQAISADGGDTPY